MNIFYLDDNPVIAAQSLVDRHLPKMIVESAQILSNCFTTEQLQDAPKSQKGLVRKHSYPHHPCCKWVRRSRANMMWVIKNALAMQEEREYRFNSNEHFSLSFIRWCADNIHLTDIPDIHLTDPEMAFNGCDNMKDQNNISRAYRRFYAHDKRFDTRGRPMDIYTKRPKPSFWNER